MYYQPKNVNVFKQTKLLSVKVKLLKYFYKTTNPICTKRSKLKAC